MDQAKENNAESIRTQHSAILSSIDTLKTLIATPVEQTRTEVTEQVRSLHTFLDRHFAFEENNEPLAELIVETWPEKLEIARHLLDEHRILSSTIAGIEADLSTAKPLETIASELRDFFAALQGHEGAEDELLFELYYRVDGGPD